MTNETIKACGTDDIEHSVRQKELATQRSCNSTHVHN